ncbi:hypothetical protein HUU05_01930 [candidate division KSB1 bacterium]|nr:hypothetical protein [candidate division KSB1 bacterium]
MLWKNYHDREAFLECGFSLINAKTLLNFTRLVKFGCGFKPPYGVVEKDIASGCEAVHQEGGSTTQVIHISPAAI